MVHIIENPIIPLTTPIYEGMRNDSMVEIFGESIVGHQGGFTIEFLVHSGIAFNVSVRMSPIGGGIVAFNHFSHRKWHREVHHPNPLALGQHFHMKITSERRKFEVHINGICVGHYHAHISTKKVNMMTIRGDVRVGKVHFHNFKHENGGGELITIPAAIPQPPPPTVLAPVVTAPAAVPVAAVTTLPTAPPAYQTMYPTVTPVVYSQPEVVYIDSRHHHGHYHHC